MTKILTILLLISISLNATTRSLAKLELACDIGNEKACQKLLELKNNTSSPTRQSYKSVSKKTHKDPFLAKVCNKDILSWRDLNVDKYKLESLRKLGVDSPEEAKKWICAGAYGNGAGFDWDIAKWQREGFKTADEFIAYNEAKLADKKANEIRRKTIQVKPTSEKIDITNHTDSKYHSISTISEYDKIVCDRYVLEAFPDIKKIHTTANWMDLESSFLRNNWKKRKISALDALRFGDMKVTPSKYDSLSKLGVTTALEAKKWICAGAYGNGAGFNWDIAKYKRNGINTPEELSAYKMLNSSK